MMWKWWWELSKTCWLRWACKLCKQYIKNGIKAQQSSHPWFLFFFFFLTVGLIKHLHYLWQQGISFPPYIFSDIYIYTALHCFCSYFEADIFVWPSILSVKRQAFNLLKFILVWGRLKHGIDLRGVLWSHKVQSVFHLHFRPYLTLYLKILTPQVLSIST